MINDILAYVIVGLLTIGWLFSIVMDFMKKISEKQKSKSNDMEEAK